MLVIPFEEILFISVLSVDLCCSVEELWAKLMGITSETQLKDSKS